MGSLTGWGRLVAVEEIAKRQSGSTSHREDLTISGVQTWCEVLLIRLVTAAKACVAAAAAG